MRVAVHKDQLNFFDILPDVKPEKKSVKTGTAVKKETIKKSAVKNSVFNFSVIVSLIKEYGLKVWDFKNFEEKEDLGRFFYELWLHKPYMYFDEIKTLFKEESKEFKYFHEMSFWGYSQKLFSLPPEYIFTLIRIYEIRNLLRKEGFRKLPEYEAHIKELIKYTDSQIIEIWKNVDQSKKLTASAIKTAKYKVRSKHGLKYRVDLDTGISFYKYQSDFYRTKYDRRFLEVTSYYEAENKELKIEKDSIKKKYESLMRDILV